MLKDRFFLKCILLLLTLLPAVLQAQNFSRYNWYFGSSNNAIRFSRSDNSASHINFVQAPPLGVGGSAVASSKLNGDLLFYTDGVNVFDITNTRMLNGLGLTGNASANQPVAIAKVPGQVSQYYIFTNSANFTTGGTISFSIVDMALPGNSIAPAPPSGDVINPKNTFIIGGRSEAMITVPHANGEDFWLITHANGSNDFDVFRFTAAQLTPDLTINFPGLGLTEVAANLSYHERTGRIALSPQEETRDVEILNFDNATGILSLNQYVVNSGLNSTLGQAIYDTEWSNSGQYLYLSVHGDAGPPVIQADVLQYDLLTVGTTLTSVLPTSIFRSYGLQVAPDSAIYHLYQSTAGGPFFVGKLTNSDTIPTEVIYTPQAFAGTINFAGLQFPSFAPSDTTGITVTIQPVTACANTPVTFYPTVTPGADSIVWDFGDGFGGSGWSPVHTYTAQGSFPVTATAFLNGQSVTSIPQPATISQFDLTLSLVSDTTACACEFKPPYGSSCNGGPFNVTVSAQNGSPTYQWFGPSGLLASQNTATLTPDSSGYYYVVATVGLCSAYAGVNIKAYDSLDQRANIWYFGNGAGIDFNPLPSDPAVAISNSVMNTTEGTSIICDRNGQVVFFTDGDKVWLGDDPVTPFTEVASGIGGTPEPNQSTQSALIVPFPGDETMYYIFTTTAIDGFPASYELRYSVFDLKLNGGLGGIVDTDANPATFLGTLLFTKCTERITSNGNWLIAHEFGNNSFRAYPITAQGIGNPVISSIGSDHVFTPVQNGQGYMELGSTGNLAVALSTPGTSNTVEIFDFIDSTGMITNYRVADLKIPAGQVYGLEFSGSKLLTTWSDGTNSQIVEFFFNAGDSVFISKAPPVSVPPGVHLGAIQTGPDGQVYVAVEGASALGTIQVDGDTTSASNTTFLLAGFPLLGGTTSHLGLPNFVQTLANPSQLPGITFTGVCLGNPTDFTGSGKDSNIDKFDWSFGDGITVLDGGPQVSHTYVLAGTYPVTLTVRNKCEDPVAVFTRDVTISPPPSAPTILQAFDTPFLCTGAKVLEATPSTNPDLSRLDFLWTTGDTTRTITVNQTNFYGVTITDNLGCSSTGNMLILDNRPQVDLPANSDACQNDPPQTLNAQNPALGNTFLWTVTTGGVTTPTGSTIQTQQVDKTVVGVFEYEVTVTFPNGCSAKDSSIFSIKPAPLITNIIPTNTSICGANDGSFRFDITGPANTLYRYDITGLPTVFNQGLGTVNVPSTPPNNLAPGTYGIFVQDQVSFCPNSNTVTINDNGFTVSAPTSASTCAPFIINVVHTAVINPITYRVIDAISGVEIVPTTAGAVGSINTPGVPAGSYIVEIRSGGCTVSSTPITLAPASVVAITFDQTDMCNGNLTALTVPAATTFNWSASETGSLASPGTAIGATVPLNPGTWDMVVTADDPGAACPGTATITVTYETFTPDFTQQDQCQDQDILSATPTSNVPGTYRYDWIRNGAAPVQWTNLFPVTLADNTATYAVTVRNNSTGCEFTSATKPILVDGLLDVFLTTTPPCEGTPFTITATPSRANVTSQWKFKALNQPVTNLPDTDLDATGTASGNYSVVVTSTTLSSCTNTADLDIVVSPLTPGLLSDQYLICPEGTNDVNHVVLRPGYGFLSYNWFKENITTGDVSDTLDVFEVGHYSVELVNQFGCTSTDQTLVKEECDPVIVGPTAFRPTSTLQGQGGDLVNQTFRLFTFFISDDDFQVFIFNRWGEMIYQTNQRDFRWNGGYNNDFSTQLPAGTYSYVVKYKSQYHPEQGIMEKRGGVVLLR